MDQARIMSLIRHILTGLGMAFAGSGFAEYFTDTNINLAVTIVGGLVAFVATWWGNRSSTPVALAQKLVDNPALNNAQVARAIEQGAPERIVVEKAA